ncbi:hypothetical protein B0H16DRAFT_1722565 [Mycena metata]|uniref:Uncharacterized protein n=1 Tax=Mycena metata TaxID=1033252 RepID=A0AAD7NCE5_9AGAR|nr:hypothetical protein B0H16DRAFT_1722565 [Mycena metata]
MAFPIPGTLRSGREFATHAIVLDDFDVLEHAHAARARSSDADLASDDHPITTPVTSGRRDRLPPRSRSESPPPRRSSRLAPPIDDSIDRSGRTRAARRAAEQLHLGTPLKRVVRRHVSNAEPIHITTAPTDYPVTSTGWSGIRDRETQQREYTIPKLQREFGMRIVEWDGRTSRPLVDRESRVIAVLGGRPNDPEYLRLTEQAARELEAARAELHFRPEQRSGRRGAFPAVSAGISFGGGQQVPGNLSLPIAMTLVFQRLFSLACFFRISGFANGLFQTWNPAVHALYVSTLDALTNDFNTGLRRNFTRRLSAFAAATLNFGPATVTLPVGLVFHHSPWLIIRFPPGSTILIPSAILRHSNVSIAAGEQRYSFTQYTAAGLFRWVDNDFRTEHAVEEAIRRDAGAQVQRVRERQTRWATGINSYKRWTARS